MDGLFGPFARCCLVARINSPVLICRHDVRDISDTIRYHIFQKETNIISFIQSLLIRAFCMESQGELNINIILHTEQRSLDINCLSCMTDLFEDTRHVMS